MSAVAQDGLRNIWDRLAEGEDKERPSMGDACAYRDAPGLYCASPFDFTTGGLDAEIEPPPIPFALCNCDRKASEGTQCQAADGEELNGTMVCTNKFGCMQTLFPSILGYSIQRDLQRIRRVPPGQIVLTAQPSLSPAAVACRCNSGLQLGLDVRSTFCNQFSLKYERREEPGYFTSSGRFANAKGEFDYYAREIVDYILADMRSKVDSPPKGTSAYETKQLQSDLSTYAKPVREMVCSMVYPRCAQCHNIFEDPALVFNNQQDHVVCYDPTTCRSLCNSTLRLHASFLPRFVDCVLNGKCENSSRIWHKQSIRDYVIDAVRKDPSRLCLEETVCQLRSINGYLQPDKNLDPRAVYYESEDPMADTIGFIIFTSVTVVVLTIAWWLSLKYTADVWKKTRESGAKGYGSNSAAAN